MAEVDYENYVIPEGDIMTPEELEEVVGPHPIGTKIFPGTYIHQSWSNRKSNGMPNICSLKGRTGLEGVNGRVGIKHYSGSLDLQEVWKEVSTVKTEDSGWSIPVLGSYNKHIRLICQSSEMDPADVSHFFIPQSSATLKDIGSLIARERAFNRDNRPVRIRHCSHSDGKRHSALHAVIRYSKAKWYNGSGWSSMGANSQGSWSCSDSNRSRILIPVRYNKVCGPAQWFRYGISVVPQGSYGNHVFVNSWYYFDQHFIGEIKLAFEKDIVEEALVQYALENTLSGSYSVSHNTFLTKMADYGQDADEYWNFCNPITLTWSLGNTGIYFPDNRHREGFR